MRNLFRSGSDAQLDDLVQAVKPVEFSHTLISNIYSGKMAPRVMLARGDIKKPDERLSFCPSDAMEKAWHDSWSALPSPGRCTLREVIQRADVIFLNNAEETMSTRNQVSRVRGRPHASVQQMFRYLVRSARNGTRIVAMAPLFWENNNWDVDSSDPADRGYWMETRKASITGSVSWNVREGHSLGRPVQHAVYIYTKRADAWKCNACKVNNDLMDESGAPSRSCQLQNDHIGYAEEKRTLRTRKRARKS